MEEIFEDSTLGGYFIQDRDRTEISEKQLGLLEQEARDIYDSELSGHDSYLEQIRIEVPKSSNPERNYETQSREIADMIIDLS